MKNHLKRIALPKSWNVDRKSNKFIMRPYPGAHSLTSGLPLGIILRDILKLTSTMSEVKKALNSNQVLVDGKVRRDARFIVGLFDVLTFSTLEQHYRVVFDKKGRIIVVKIPATESSFKPCKIVGKHVLPGGKIQFNLHDGKNVVSDKESKVGDSMVLTLPKLEIKEILPLETGATVFLMSGKHSGQVGVLKEIRGKEATYTTDGQDTETVKNYLFVIGKDKPVITVKNPIEAKKQK